MNPLPQVADFGSPFSNFGIVLSFDADRTVVEVRGEVDVATAPALRAFLDIATRRGGLLVLDCAGVSFFDASGLGEVARALNGLRKADGDLIVTSPSPMTYKAFEITEFTKELDIERPGPPVRLGPSKLSPAAAITAISDGGLDDVVLTTALMLVVVLARATVAQADGASVSLFVGEHLETLAASDDVIAGMDADQYSLGEGPCVSAATLGTGFHIASVAAETRWGAFPAKAEARGIGAVLSTPLLIGSRSVGALNIYSRRPEAFAQSQGQLAGLLAGHAAAVVSAHARQQEARHVLSSSIEGALAERHTVALAQGILMERGGISPEAAHARLRRGSRVANSGLAHQAGQIVISTRRPPAQSIQGN